MRGVLTQSYYFNFGIQICGIHFSNLGFSTEKGWHIPFDRGVGMCI